MSIDVQIFSRNVDVQDRLHDYVVKKVSKLDRYLPNIDEARVDLSFVKSARSISDRFVAQITIRGKGFILRAEEDESDFYTAIDLAHEKIQRRIETFKGKRARMRTEAKETSLRVMDQDYYTESDLEQRDQTVVRRKTFHLSPMDELEAIEQMSLLGHENFFLFFNIRTNKINLLYRRHDGGFGLLEPELN